MSHRSLTAAEEGDRIASAAEVEAALDSLSPVQQVQLKKCAQAYVARLGSRAFGRTWDELLSEAYLSALDRTRKWDKSKVDFVGFLVGAMRSIASNWKGKVVRAEEVHKLGEGGRIRHIALYELDDDGDEVLLPLESSDPSPEQQLLDKELVERLLQVAEQRNDHSACVILELMEGRKGPEIQRSLGITQTQYETERKWLRRNVSLILSGEETHGAAERLLERTRPPSRRSGGVSP